MNKRSEPVSTLPAARIAILSNSHAAALELAWQAMGRNSPLIRSLTIFARPNGQKGLHGFELVGRTFHARNEDLAKQLRMTAGTSSMAVDDYDAFVVHAMGIDPGFLIDAVRNLEGRHYSARLLSTNDADVRLAAMKASRSTLFHSLPRAIRSVTDAPVLVTHQPWIAETAPGCHLSAAHAPRVQQAILAGLEDLCLEMNCTFVPQPACTIAPNGLSRAGFARDDHRHMNAEYGRIMLDEFARLISAARQARGRPAAP